MRFRAAILAGFLLLWSTPAFSQACSMCYSTAKATSREGQRAISKGVVVLLLPPLGFMTLGVWTAFRYARKRDRELSGAPMLRNLRADLGELMPEVVVGRSVAVGFAERFGEKHPTRIN
jgi:hypothetical protein